MQSPPHPSGYSLKQDEINISSQSECKNQDISVTSEEFTVNQNLVEVPNHINLLESSDKAEISDVAKDDAEKQKIAIIRQEILVKPLLQPEIILGSEDGVSYNNIVCNLEKSSTSAHDETGKQNEEQETLEEPSNSSTTKFAKQDTNSNNALCESEELLDSVDDGNKNVQARERFLEPSKESQLKDGNDSTIKKVLSNVVDKAMEIEVFAEKNNIQTETPCSSLNAASSSELNEPEENKSSLALLAQYDSDGDSDDVCEVPVKESYQSRCVEINSDSDTSDVEFLDVEYDSINLDLLGAQDDECDDETYASSRQPKVKGELGLEDLPPIEDLHITVPEEECVELGVIHSIVEQLVLVNALPGTVPLDLETVLFRDKGNQVLGEIFDVLGQVSDPLYCVRFNSNKEIKDKGIEIGQKIYVAPRTKHTQFVILSNLMKDRGSDASWEHDIEPPPRYIEYSDDEEERSARRPRRNRNRAVDNENEGAKRPYYGGNSFVPRGPYTPRTPYRGNYVGPGSRPPYPQPPRNYNIVGSSWHSNFHQNPVSHHQQYQMPPNNSHVGYRPPLQSGHYQQPSVNPGLVINPYAVFPPPQVMQLPLFPPPLHQLPPPPPPPQ